ncbi:MAG: hypothetical protein JXA62_07380 [Candidatus Aminicenantes bacterium]|nr:hypothetical protein [Candidatus Aminicenantes bacterium]
MIREFLCFESGRVLGDRRIVGVGAIILLITAFLVVSGYRNHAAFQLEKQAFVDYERQRIPQYVNYAQYAALGFRVLFEPSPLAVFTESSRLLASVESKVDMSELVQIYNVHKGRQLFSVRGYFSDVFGFLFVTGTLIMVYSGATTFSSRAALALRMQFLGYSRVFWGVLLSRFAVLSVLFCVPITAICVLVLCGSIAFTPAEIRHLMAAGLLLWLMLAFFFILGFTLKGVFRFRKHTLLWSFLIWFALVFLIPELVTEYVYVRSQRLPSNDSLNFQKLRVVLENEARAVEHVRNMSRRKDVDMKAVVRDQVHFFMKNIHLLNRNIEFDLTRRVSKLIRQYERVSLLIPTQFFLFINREISGLGYCGYLEFKQYVMHLQERFMRFFFQQHYFHRAEKVKSFVRPGENVYQSPSFITAMFGWGVCLILLYMIMMCAWSQRRYQRLVKEP